MKISCIHSIAQIFDLESHTRLFFSFKFTTHHVPLQRYPLAFPPPPPTQLHPPPSQRPPPRFHHALDPRLHPLYSARPPLPHLRHAPRFPLPAPLLENSLYAHLPRQYSGKANFAIVAGLRFRACGFDGVVWRGGWGGE